MLSFLLADECHTWLNLFTLQTLPYWDWTQYYSSGCLIKNPFYQEESTVELSEEDCKV